MAHHKAAKKSIRQAEKRNEANRYYGKTTRNAIRKLRAAEPAEAEKMLPTVVSMIDKLAKRNVIHKNKAANIKSALMRPAAAVAEAK
jgi:small subunit ribosomal protein S20